MSQATPLRITGRGTVSDAVLSSDRPTRGKLPGAGARLPGLPRTLSVEEQLDALRRVQSQAEQRVKLGVQLFKAAEARTEEHRDILAQMKAEQDKLRDELQGDVSRSLHSYDQWLGKMDEDFTGAITQLEAKIEKMQAEWTQAQERIESMVRRSEAMLDQARCLLEQETGQTVAKADVAAAAVPAAPEKANVSLTIAAPPLPETITAAESAPPQQPAPPATPSPESTSVAYSELLARMRSKSRDDETA